MDSVLTYLLFGLGFPALVGGAYLLVRGAGSLALGLGVSELTVGLTVVALGTSAPELVVSLLAAASGSADLALGNVVGSNLSNILLILGAAALVSPLAMRDSLRRREIPWALLACLVPAVMVNDRALAGAAWGGLDRGDGLVLLAFLAVFLYYVFSVAQRQDAAGVDKVAPVSMPAAAGMAAAGVAALALGGDWIVDGASALAAAWGMSQALIGLTIVAVGTSLPELATSLLAAWRGNADLAVGNVVGSNILNVFWILGVSSAISPVGFNPGLNPDLAAMTAATLLLFLFTYTGGRHRVDRGEGLLFLACYAGYLAFTVWRG
jgi:cation:H+ antiporter